MSRKTTWLVFIVALLAGASAGWLILHLRERREAESRERRYQRALAGYAAMFAPGTPRDRVEYELYSNHVRFRQFCCFEEKTTYVDAIDIAQDKDDVPWYCSERQVFVALEFRPTGPHQTGKMSDPYDVVTKVSLEKRLGGCL